MTRSRPHMLLVLLAVSAIAAAGAIGYLVGHHQANRVFTVGTGMVYLTPTLGTAYYGTTFGGNNPNAFAYGVPANVSWIDSTGTIHEGTRPTCVPFYRISRVVMETVQFPIAGAMTGTVLWVRC